MVLLDWLIASVSPTAALRRAVRLTDQGDVKRAFPLLTRAARAGNAEAEYRVGRCYLEASGVPPSVVEGVRWLERAAHQGYVDAQARLATLSIHGLAVSSDASSGHSGGPAATLFTANEASQPDFDAGIRWARKAAEAGSADGQAVLGYILTSGPEHLRNLDEAHQWYERSAAAGSPQGALGYALSLARTATDQEGQARVAEHLRQAADAGLPTGLYLLGIMTERGLGMPADRAAAIQLFRQAAEKGNRPSQARWGLALMEGQDVPANPTEGESWLRRAALAGDPEAAAVVGDLYAKGGRLPPNFAEAAIWFRRAAETGHRGASRALGLLHLTGAGVPRDSEEAARWFRVSAEAGNPSARVDLANLLLRGEASAEDAVRTREWFEQAAASGDLVAAFNFGVCLAEGVGVERDDRKAAEWLRRAADGVVNAQYWYGRMLSEGRGLDANPEEGRAWIQRAADVGMVEAEVLLAEMMLTGRGGSKDHPAALALFEKAARPWPCRCHVCHGCDAWRRPRSADGPAHRAEVVRRGGGTRACLCPDDAGPLPGAWPRRRAGLRSRPHLAGEGGRPGPARGAWRPRRPAAASRSPAGRTAGGRSLTGVTEQHGRGPLPENVGLALEAFERAQAETAAGNHEAARRWLDRACRLAPHDQTLSLALATACLGSDDTRAAALFATISAANDVREAWFGLATARRRLGDVAGAASALASALARHAPDGTLAALSDAIAREAGAPGWCGLSGDGKPTIRPLNDG